jgi:hypothetical protein
MGKPIRSTRKELDEFLAQTIRDGWAVFDPVVEKYRLTQLGQKWHDYYVHEPPPSKEFICKTLEHMVRMGHATFDPATKIYAPTELALRLMRELPDSDYYDLLWGKSPSKKL